MQKYKKEIRNICTYSSEFGEGTMGYDLSEEQFQKIFNLIESLLIQERKREIKMIKEMEIKVFDRGRMLKNGKCAGCGLQMYKDNGYQHQCDGYNLAINDILSQLKKGNNETVKHQKKN